MPQTSAQIDQLLRSIGRAPNRKLGQHFMIDGNLVRKLVDQAGAADSPVVLEVGPGTGTLTETMLEAGLTVAAVEIDTHLADLLGDELAGRHPDRLHLIAGDVLAGKHEIEPRVVETLSRLAGDGRPVRLVANLPYNIASPLLAELIGWAWKTRHGQAPRTPLAIDRLVFTVQREVADRLSAGPGGKDYGPLSVLCQGLGEVHTLSPKISPNAFYPRPNVHSAMVRIDLPPERLGGVEDLAVLHAWLDAAFAHRRKTLSKSIRLLQGGEWEVRMTTAAMACGVDLSRRGETLAVEEFLELVAAT